MITNEKDKDIYNEIIQIYKNEVMFKIDLIFNYYLDLNNKIQTPLDKYNLNKKVINLDKVKDRLYRFNKFIADIIRDRKTARNIRDMNLDVLFAPHYQVDNLLKKIKEKFILLNPSEQDMKDFEQLYQNWYNFNEGVIKENMNYYEKLIDKLKEKIIVLEQDNLTLRELYKKELEKNKELVK